MTEFTRRYPFDVRPGHRESLDSYTRRILAANFETPSHEKQLRNLGAKAFPPQNWEQVLSAKTARELSNLRRPAAYSGNPIGCRCTACIAATERHFLCVLCAHGEHIEQEGHFDANVCIRHRRWVGPNVPPDRQLAGGRALVKAERDFRRLRTQGRIDAPLYAMLDRTVSIPIPATRTSQNRPDLKYIAMINTAYALTEPSLLRQMFDPRRTYADAFELLRQMLHKVVPEANPTLARQIWLYLRSTFLTLRDSLYYGVTYTPASQHDFRIPAEIVAELHRPIGPAEPFGRFLFPTGDQHINRINCAEVVIHRTPEAEARRIAGDNRPSTAICRHGHRFTRTLRDIARTASTGTENCTVCERKELRTGVNDMATTHPGLADQFHWTKNGTITAADIFAGSSKTYWWRCSNDHDWPATASNRSAGGSTCPVCTNREIRSGENDLTTTHPEAARWWHPERNQGIAIGSIAAGSNLSVWWRCSNGHELKHTVGTMTRNLYCKHCARADRSNTLQAARPDLANELDRDGNRHRDITKLTIGSKERADWVCTKFHKYDQRVDRRAAGGGCPVCRNRRLAQGINDAETKHPEIAKEWHPSLNGFVEPDSIFPGTAKFHWKCLRHGHLTIQSFPHRVKTKGCPECSPSERILCGEII